MSGTSLGTSLLLTVLAFVAWTGYRVASFGGMCLVLAGGGLVLQEMVGWMPAEHVELLVGQFGVVAVAAVVAIPFGLRRHHDGFSGMVTAVVFAVVSVGILLFTEPAPFLRIVPAASAAVLMLIAVHVLGQLSVLPRAAAGTYLPVRRMWRWSMLTASAGILVGAAGGMMPQPWLALSLLFLGFAGLAVALQLAAFTFILVRNGAFAQAWAKPWSPTRRAATVDLVVWVAVDVGALVMLGVPLVVRSPAPVTAALLVAGSACVVTGGVTLRRMLDRAAHHRRHRETPANLPAASALRELMESEPVYRLLPGIARRG
ncbi:hypothetical protein HTV45_17475 [Streptomyces sp. CHD11]|uniref:hypothetical protein n=1 Tax=Streptomyces sp. CHD11 TaxID=2741325 RepID=UPI001BFCC18B|nr:hypothetical protein [Streptomyces sp. CHD11]MBT3152642.1 hypothetical protein [Streptomyces sp. CHD11]